MPTRGEHRGGVRNVVRPLRCDGDGPGSDVRRPAPRQGEDARVTSNGGRQVVLDDVSRAIIEQLQEDGRRSYARIASAVGLSEAAVRQRVQRLLDAGVMQIDAVTDPMQVGFPWPGMP